MKILITGHKGFIGKNTFFQLKDNFNLEVLGFGRENKEDDLINKISESDFIIHCAGVNKTTDNNEFNLINHGLTKKICEINIKLNKFLPIIFTSSIHTQKNNAYGVSKLNAEKELFEYSKKTNSRVYIFRLPHVMGKWCKPNYNSVIATFCHNIANNIPIEINPQNPKINIVYIDDLIREFYNLIIDNKKESQIVEIKKTYNISIEKLAEEINQIKNSQETLSIDGFADGFKKSLYSTYLSYQSEKDFSYVLESNEDIRGKFVEVLKSKKAGQFSFLTINKEKVRGKHYHHSKIEKFLVISGKVKFKLKHILSDKEVEIIVDEKDNKIVDMIPGWAHKIENVGDDVAKVMIWANEIFDPKSPDTIQKDL